MYRRKILFIGLILFILALLGIIYLILEMI